MVTGKININPAVSLELDMETAEILVDVLNNVGGPPEGPRGKMDELLNLLRNLGISRHGCHYEGYTHIYEPK